MFEKINYNAEDLKDHHGVSAVIKNEKGEILMQEHVKYGFWTIPVGKVSFEDDLIDGLKLEVFEETNLKVDDCKEIKFKLFEYIRNGKPVKVYTHLFEITKYSGELQNKEPQKHRKQEFLGVDKIMKLPYISDTTIMYLDILGLSRSNKI